MFDIAPGEWGTGSRIAGEQCRNLAKNSVVGGMFGRLFISYSQPEAPWVCWRGDVGFKGNDGTPIPELPVHVHHSTFSTHVGFVVSRTTTGRDKVGCLLRSRTKWDHVSGSAHKQPERRPWHQGSVYLSCRINTTSRSKFAGSTRPHNGRLQNAGTRQTSQNYGELLWRSKLIVLHHIGSLHQRPAPQLGMDHQCPRRPSSTAPDEKAEATLRL